MMMMMMNSGIDFVLRLGLSIMVVACSSSILIDSARTGGGYFDAGTSKLKNVVQLKTVDEISGLQTKLPAAAVELDCAYTTAAMTQRSELEANRVSESRNRVSESDDTHVSKIGEEEEAADLGNGDSKQNKQDEEKKKRLERFLRFSDYTDPKDHPPEEPPSLINP